MTKIDAKFEDDEHKKPANSGTFYFSTSTGTVTYPTTTIIPANSSGSTWQPEWGTTSTTTTAYIYCQVCGAYTTPVHTCIPNTTPAPVQIPMPSVLQTGTATPIRTISDEDIERIAKRVLELLKQQS